MCKPIEPQERSRYEVLRSVEERKRKKKRLEAVNVIERQRYDDLNLNAKVELVRSLIPLGLMHVHELLD